MESFAKYGNGFWEMWRIWGFPRILILADTVKVVVVVVFFCWCCLVYGSVWKGQLYIFLSFLFVFLFIFFSVSRYLYFYSYIFIWLYIFTFSDALWETVRMIISYNRIREHTKYIFFTRLSLCSCSFLGEILPYPKSLGFHFIDCLRFIILQNWCN